MSVGLAIPFMTDFVTRGIKPTEALRIFRRAGGSIRTQEWFRAFKTVTAQVGHVETIKGYRSTRIIRKESFEELGRSYKQPLAMRGEYEATDVLTGERVRGHATALSKREMTRGEWEEELEAGVMRTEESPTMTNFSWLELTPEWGSRFEKAKTDVR